MHLLIDLASSEEKSQLRTLLADCLSELSRYGTVDYAYPYFDTYWDHKERRWPYLIRQRNQIVGFSLVNTWSPSGNGTDFAIAEFYIVPDARGCGIGHNAAKNIFLMHTGIWELSVMSLNAPAQRFWPKAIAAAQVSTLERMQGDGEMIYRFTTG
ncbi:MAG: GNAT family N-acetyltransferase [Advenella sp.]|uniref:N-acetyltransferase domain-containing protein n=1 Tax=Advenella kashmirensis TaxID=310575 RepID=A0A356LBS1_9BURK|nr:GNAT family N-acetyltransferase [Advenella sp. FME57]HBP28001.1 hypothetical protein [Advenella kashmirensis]